MGFMNYKLFNGKRFDPIYHVRTFEEAKVAAKKAREKFGAAIITKSTQKSRMLTHPYTIWYSLGKRKLVNGSWSKKSYKRK